MYSPALCRSLIEGKPSTESAKKVSRILRLYAGASLKDGVIGERMFDRLGILRLYAGASLKAYGDFAIQPHVTSILRLYAGASLKV